jgi:hypothetical protein
MNQILSGLAGAVILAAAYATFVLARRIGAGAKQLTAALNGIPKLVKSQQEVAVALHRFSGELEFLRTAMIGGTPEAEPGEAANPTAQPRPRGGPIPSFPQWQPFVASPADVPDAAVEDTEVIDTSDEDFVQQEQIEEIRGQGFAAGPEADPMENPPGVTANV